MSQAKRFRELINNTFEISQTVDGVKTVYVSGDDVQLYVKKHYGSAYCYFENTTDLKADFDHFNRLHVTDFIRLLQALQFDYNPCENYDRYEEMTNSHTGTIGVGSNGNTTSKTSAYDSDSFVDDTKLDSTNNTTTTFNNSDGVNSHIHGNIGVQTVSNMIMQSGTGEAFLRFNNFVEHYLNRWICDCIVAYGDEENEIEFAPDKEYATIDYVDNAVDTMGDSLEVTIGLVDDRVDNLSDTVDTLNNSLGAVITDIDSNIKPTIEELINDDSDHESRITALENSSFSGFELLWENPNPTQGISPQTIPIDTKNYTMFMAIVRRKNDNANYSDYWIEKGNQTSCMAIYSGRITFRNLTVSNNELTLANAVIYETYGNESVNQDYMIPVRLYGIY